jgi:HSP20 family protein
MATLTKRTNGNGSQIRTVRGSDIGSSLYDPFTEQIRSMRRLANTLFANGSMNGIEAVAFPPVELYEKDDNFVLEVLVPGFKRDEINIEVNDTRVTISGSSERQAVEDRLKGQVHQSEFERNDFQRTISLPTEVDAERVSARLQDGLLTIALPRLSPTQAKRVAITA